MIRNAKSDETDIQAAARQALQEENPEESAFRRDSAGEVTQ
jgi:hypothetical protein